MFFLRISVFLIFIFLTWCESSKTQEFRIVDGREASPYEFPFHAELVKYGRHHCGGAIIHKNFIITVAHCVKDYESIKPLPIEVLHIQVGNEYSATGGIVHQIRNVYTHYNYIPNSKIFTAEIAVVSVETPFTITDTVKLIRLSNRTPPAGQLGWVIGFGQEHLRRQGPNRHLMAVEIPVRDTNECRNILHDVVADDMICAGYPNSTKDSCKGDSGGPFVSDYTLIGIVAWGRGCGIPGIPGVYTNVAFYSDWVRGIIGDAKKH